MNNILYSRNAAPLKNNMEEGIFSLYKRIYRQTSNISNTTLVDNTVVNNKFQDSSSYMERKKALAIGSKSYKTPITYNSYDPVNTYHTKRRVISAGTVSPKKKNIKI
jgi:hypothetical protein